MNKEQQEQQLASLEKAFGPKPEAQTAEAEVAEEPKKEVKAEEAQEVEQPEKEVEEPEAAAEEKTEEAPEEEGVITVDFGEETPEVVTPSDEDLNAYKTRIQALEEELQKTKETPTLDPRIAKLNEIVQNGGEINQAVWEMQSKEYDKLNLSDVETSFQVVKDKLSYIDGDDNDLVSFYLDDKFPTLRGKKGEDDFDSDAEYEAQKKKEEMLLRKEAKQNISSLKEFQDKMRLPSAPNHKQQEEQKEAINRYKAEATTKINEIDGFNVSLADDVKLKFPFAGEGREFAKSIVTNPENQAQFFVSRYATEDGTVDFNKFSEDMYFLSNREKVFNALYAQGKSAGKKEAVQEIQGENVKAPTQKPLPKKTDKLTESVAKMTFSRPNRR